MDRQEAIRKTAILANEYIKSRNDAECKHTSWDEINEGDENNAKKQ